jgi:alpha-amylase
MKASLGIHSLGWPLLNGFIDYINLGMIQFNVMITRKEVFCEGWEGFYMLETDQKLPRVLATDLDGTLIPLDSDSVNRGDLNVLAKKFQDASKSLVFVTGRHLASVESAIKEFSLPRPDWIICDVGSTICESTDSGWQPLTSYDSALRKILGRDSFQDCHSHFAQFKNLKLQELEKQGDFKMSFYVPAEKLADAKQMLEQELRKIDVNGTVIGSVDPFNGDGLLDVLPLGVSKAFALEWWCKYSNQKQSQVIFSGDSGNDFAAMTAGYKTIVVANASAELRQSVVAAHEFNGWVDRLCLAKAKATSGVLEGCQAFGLLEKL